jgi:hypothetical protein
MTLVFSRLKVIRLASLQTICNPISYLPLSIFP